MSWTWPTISRDPVFETPGKYTEVQAIFIFELVNKNFDKLAHVVCLFHLVPRGLLGNKWPLRSV